MDANQSRFHLVLGRSDWGEIPTELAYDRSCESLGLRPRVFVFPPRASEARLTLEMRRGAAVDPFDNRYWIAESGDEIRHLSRGDRVSARYWPAPADCTAESTPGIFVEVTPVTLPPPRTFHGLAVTRHHYLVVGVDAPAGLLVFDLSGGGAPQEIRWPDSVPFRPFDMAIGADGRLWILDRSARRLWSLTERLELVQLGAVPDPEVVAPEFEPADHRPLGACARPDGIHLECSVLIPAADPIALAVLDNGDLVIACDVGTHTELLTYRHPFFDGPFSLTSALAGLVDTPSTSLRAYDIAVVGADLFLVGFDGNQAFQLQVTDEAGQRHFHVQPRYFPMRLFTGKALIGNGRGAYDSGDSWPYLTEQPRRRFNAAGAIELPSAAEGFDGREPGCLWHRVFLDAAIPPGCAIAISARAADREEDLAGATWQQQPRPYRNHTGSELAWTSQRFDTWELLLQQVRGRFLQLRLSFTGTMRDTPRIHALRAYYPRFSYLREYLPAVYREDRQSESFLDRYLANPEGTLTALEGRIQDVQVLFDGRSSPDAMLDWLASWIGGVLDTAWDEHRRRLFVRYLMRFHRERGTPGGLLRMLRLTLDPCVDDALFADAGSSPGSFEIRIVESMRTIGSPGVLVGDPSDVLGPGSTTAVSSWSPALGAEPLHQRYRTFLQTRYASIDALNDSWGRSGSERFTDFLDPRLRLQALAPCQGNERAAWTDFVSSDIGFTYMPPGPGADQVYRRFLARRYRQPSALNQAYGYSGASALATWADVTPKLWLARLTYSIPAGGPALRDWIHFVSMVLPRERKAHYFTVLVPVRPDEAPEAQQRKAGVARRITEVEKPAHTTFDVKLYFALFRVGEARLGMDTVLGPGSRFTAVLLGTTGLASGYLTDVPPWTLTGRMVAANEEQCS